VEQQTVVFSGVSRKEPFAPVIDGFDGIFGKVIPLPDIFHGEGVYRKIQIPAQLVDQQGAVRVREGITPGPLMVGAGDRENGPFNLVLTLGVGLEVYGLKLGDDVVPAGDE
jgi:hypothetical protein